MRPRGPRLALEQEHPAGQGTFADAAASQRNLSAAIPGRGTTDEEIAPAYREYGSPLERDRRQARRAPNKDRPEVEAVRRATRRVIAGLDPHVPSRDYLRTQRRGPRQSRDAGRPRKTTIQGGPNKGQAKVTYLARTGPSRLLKRILSPSGEGSGLRDRHVCDALAALPPELESSFREEPQTGLNHAWIVKFSSSF